MADWIAVHPQGVLLTVWLQPRASRNEIGADHSGALKIKITAPPVDNAANVALEKFLADCLRCPRSAVRIVQGHTARRKAVLITGMSTQAVTAAIAGHQASLRKKL